MNRKLLNYNFLSFFHQFIHSFIHSFIHTLSFFFFALSFLSLGFVQPHEKSTRSHDATFSSRKSAISGKSVDQLRCPSSGSLLSIDEPVKDMELLELSALAVVDEGEEQVFAPKEKRNVQELISMMEKKVNCVNNG